MCLLDVRERERIRILLHTQEIEEYTPQFLFLSERERERVIYIIPLEERRKGEKKEKERIYYFLRNDAVMIHSLTWLVTPFFFSFFFFLSYPLRPLSLFLSLSRSPFSLVIHSSHLLLVSSVFFPFVFHSPSLDTPLPSLYTPLPPSHAANFLTFKSLLVCVVSVMYCVCV